MHISKDCSIQTCNTVSKYRFEKKITLYMLSNLIQCFADCEENCKTCDPDGTCSECNTYFFLDGAICIGSILFFLFFFCSLFFTFVSIFHFFHCFWRWPRLLYFIFSMVTYLFNIFVYICILSFQNKKYYHN